MKPFVPLLMVLMLVSVSFVGVSNQAEEPEADIEQEVLLDHLAFYCTGANGLDTAKYEYYKEKLLEDDFDDELDEVEVEPQSIVSNLIIALGSPPMDSPWSMQSHDTHHTGRSPYSTEHIDGLEKWRCEVDWLQDTPVIDNNGTIYIASVDRYVRAVYPNGTIKWEYKTYGMIQGSSPALAEDGTLYVGTWDNWLYAINSNGSVKWKFNAHDTIASSPAIAEEGTIYFGTMGDGYRIYAVNPNGTEKWHYTTGYKIGSDPAIGDDGTIYIGSGDNYLYALNPNGTLKWRYKTGDYVNGPPSIGDDGTIYAGSYDGYLYSFYPNNGTLKWKYGGIGPGTSTTPSLAEDGTIYVGGENLYAINPNGTKKWNFDPGTNRFIFKSSPTISNEGTIYFGTHIGEVSGGEIIAVNPDGTEKWRKKIAYDGWVDSSPSIGEDGTVYIGSATGHGGYLHAFGPVESNSPPETPTISGKTSGENGMQYQYKFRAVDPDNNPISFYIDWGDGNEGWESERASGVICGYRHTWSEEGEYTIRCKAKDVLGEESNWATLEVTMPKSHNPIWWLNNLLDRFPLLSRLIDSLMDWRSV